MNTTRTMRRLRRVLWILPTVNMGQFLGPASLLRRPTVQASILAILAVGIAVISRAPSANDTLIEKWEKPRKGGQETASGTSVAIMTSSGMTLSGAVKVADQKVGSGELKIGGTDGGRSCLADTDGTGCTCTQGNNGVLVSWIGSAAECP